MSAKIILDCDPGHDDAIALLLGVWQPRRGTACGHDGRRQPDAGEGHSQCPGGGARRRNHGDPVRRRVRASAGRAPQIADEIHGESGLDGPVLPDPTVSPDPRHAVDLIIETVLDQPDGSVTLVPTGPLTNIALAARKEPRIVSRVREVVLMGGGLPRGQLVRHQRVQHRDRPGSRSRRLPRAVAGHDVRPRRHPPGAGNR